MRVEFFVYDTGVGRWMGAIFLQGSFSRQRQQVQTIKNRTFYTYPRKAIRQMFPKTPCTALGFGTTGGNLDLPVLEN